MEKHLTTIVASFFASFSYAQTCVETTTPDATSDAGVALPTSLKLFVENTSAAITDTIPVFTGSSAATLTSPGTAAITGRNYLVKNVSLTNSMTALNIADTSLQTIDGLTNRTLNGLYQAVTVTGNASIIRVPALQYESVMIQSDGTIGLVLSKYFMAI